MHHHVDVAVIGAGQAGLAMGYYLGRQGRRFVLLDGAGEIGHSWISRYDSLKLFTPAQYNNLPGFPFPAAPDHYPTKDEVAAYLKRYAEAFRLPVQLNTPVLSVHRSGAAFAVRTASGTYLADQLVVATGPFQRPFIPAVSERLSPEVYQVHSAVYGNPSQLQPGPVLVVGAGNSGAQIAEELGRERQVYLSIGKRAPYRPQTFLGRSLFWWIDKLGVMRATRDSWLGRKLSEADPLIGTNLDKLARVRQVKLVGRTVKAEGAAFTFEGGETVSVPNVIWSTGFRPDYGWIDLPVFGDDGYPLHRRGVTAVPGLYFLGLRWQHTQSSSLMGGVGADAAHLAEQIAALVDTTGPDGIEYIQTNV